MFSFFFFWVSPLALLSHFFFSGALLPYSSCSLFLGMIFLYISPLSIPLFLSDILSSLLSCFSYILICSIPPTCFIFSLKSSLFIYFDKSIVGRRRDLSLGCLHWKHQNVLVELQCSWH